MSKTRHYSAIVQVIAEFRITYNGTGELGFMEMTEAASRALTHALGASQDGAKFRIPDFDGLSAEFLDSTPHDMEYEELDEEEQKPSMIEF